MPRILWLEDAAPAESPPVIALRGAGFTVECAAAGLRAIAASAPDLVVWQPGSQRDLLRAMRASGSPFIDLPVLQFVPKGDRNCIITARLEGADDVLTAPPDTAMLLATVATRIAQVGRIRAAARVVGEPATANRNQFTQRAMEAVLQGRPRRQARPAAGRGGRHPARCRRGGRRAARRGA
jgi:DNA-binding response OmpR family regulator